MNGETESHIFLKKPCKVWHLDRENGLLSHHCSCQASSPSTAAQSTSCLSTFAVEHLHNQPQTSQAANYTSGAWRSSVELQMCNWSQGLGIFSPSFPCHPPFQLPEGKAKEQKDHAGNRPGTGIYTLEKTGSSGWQGWLEGLSVHMRIAQAALSRITAQTAAGLPSVLCTVSSSPSEKHSPVGASVQQPLQLSYTQLVVLAHILLWTGFYFSSAQILNSGSSSQGQPDVPWHRGHQLPQPVWSTAPPPTQLPGGTTRSCREPPAGYGSNAEGKEMPGLSTITLFSSQISSFSPVPSHHFLFQINWLQHSLGSCLLLSPYHSLIFCTSLQK